MISTVSNAVGRYGPNPKEVERFLKFAVVGVIGAVIDFGTLNLLRPSFYSLADQGRFDSAAANLGNIIQPEGVALGIVSGIAFVLAVISNFIWNRYWTYPESRSKSKRLQMSQFVAVNAVGFLVRPPYVALTHTWFGDMVELAMPFLGSEAAHTLGDNVCQASIVGMVMLWNFFVNRYWTYADVDNVTS